MEQPNYSERQTNGVPEVGASQLGANFEGSILDGEGRDWKLGITCIFPVGEPVEQWTSDDFLSGLAHVLHGWLFKAMDQGVKSDHLGGKIDQWTQVGKTGWRKLNVFNLDGVLSHTNKARETLNHLCKVGPDKGFLMTIPVNEDRDTDVIIGAALAAIPGLVQRIRDLEELTGTKAIEVNSLENDAFKDQQHREGE